MASLLTDKNHIALIGPPAQAKEKALFDKAQINQFKFFFKVSAAAGAFRPAAENVFRPAAGAAVYTADFAAAVRPAGDGAALRVDGALRPLAFSFQFSFSLHRSGCRNYSGELQAAGVRVLRFSFP